MNIRHPMAFDSNASHFQRQDAQKFLFFSLVWRLCAWALHFVSG
jgi:hypothetical protein